MWFNVLLSSWIMPNDLSSLPCIIKITHAESEMRLMHAKCIASRKIHLHAIEESTIHVLNRTIAISRIYLITDQLTIDSITLDFSSYVYKFYTLFVNAVRESAQTVHTFYSLALTSLNCKILSKKYITLSRSTLVSLSRRESVVSNRAKHVWKGKRKCCTFAK